MKTAILLTRRNLRIFFCDRAGVFFSLLSALMLFALYALFLGNLQVEHLRTNFPQASTEEVSAFVDSWVCAGITMITALTTGLAALNVFVDDASSGRFKDFLVSPIKRTAMILGYMFSSFVIALLMTVVVMIVGQLYMALRGEPLMTVGQIVQCGAYVVVSAASFSALSSFVVTWIRSSASFSALNTIVGTVIGFLAGAYIPAGTLPTGVVQVVNAFPFAQSAMLIRQPSTQQAFEALTHGQTPAATAFAKFYGITIAVGDSTILPGFALVELAGLAILFTILGARRMGRSIR